VTLMRRTAISIALVAVFLQIASLASAQAPASAVRRRTVTATRLVVQFSDIEERLTAAMLHKDEAALSKLLSQDFEQWTPAPPGDPIPREEWLHNVLTAFTLDSFRLSQIAVRTVDKSELVSFVLSRKAVCVGRDCGGNVFVVDLWQEQRNGTAQLLVRYISLDQGRLQQPPQPPPRPTGKE